MRKYRLGSFRETPTEGIPPIVPGPAGDNWTQTYNKPTYLDRLLVPEIYAIPNFVKIVSDFQERKYIYRVHILFLVYLQSVIIAHTFI